MALEIPYDKIKSLQISLRKEAGLSSYNPDNDHDSSLLPSLRDLIPEIDPSPPDLRCKHCKARFLRGISSIICVFCGRQQHNSEVPPDPIKFMSTFGCRWFLQSLDLDGSELVEPPAEENEFNRGQHAPQNEIPLSDYLDLEIRWPSELEKIETTDKTAAQKLSTLNLAGFDLDNYFAESKMDTLSKSSNEQFMLNKHDCAAGNNAFQGHGNLSLFVNVQPSETVLRSKEDESSESFSGWEAEFKSAGSGTQQQESKSFDPSVGSLSVDLSAHIDSVFGPGQDLFDGGKRENTASSSSNMNDWFEGDQWSNSNAGLAVPAEQFEATVNVSDGGTVASANNSSSINLDWIQDNQWQINSRSKSVDNKSIDNNDSFNDWNGFTSSTSVQVPSNNKASEEYDESIDDWNDFTSSTSAQVHANGASEHVVNHMMSSVGQAKEINLFGGTSNLQDVDFGNFSQPDLFSGAFNSQNGSKEVNILQPETSVSDRLAGMNTRDGGSIEVEKGRDVSDGNIRSKADDVETLMSQMHDLSFMLESNLSVPQKIDLQKIDPFSSFSKD